MTEKRVWATCGACGRLVHARDASCPFCARRRRRGLKGLIAALTGGTAFVAGIGCAYGCPDSKCLDFYPDAGTDAAEDAAQDTAAGDATHDAPTDARGE